MKETIDITSERRLKQIEYNKLHNITPKSTIRELDINLKTVEDEIVASKLAKLDKMPKKEREKLVNELKAKMLEASKKLEFEEAARLRDEIAKIRKM
jgi:excinuclease ABC subunit B